MGFSSEFAIREANRNKAAEAWEKLTEIGFDLKVGYPVSDETLKKFDEAVALVSQCKKEKEETY